MNSTIIVVFEFFVATGIIGFWIYFFLVENKNPERSEVYFGFERSFPLPDLGWIAPCLIISAIGILTDQSYGIVLLIAGGGALIFLGLVDTSFNLQNKGYTSKIGDTIMNICINAASLIFGIIFILYGAGQIN
jgi:hypothetical protein